MAVSTARTDGCEERAVPGLPGTGEEEQGCRFSPVTAANFVSASAPRPALGQGHLCPGSAGSRAEATQGVR